MGQENSILTNQEKFGLLMQAQAQMSQTEFASHMAQAAIGPIAETMIEDSFGRKLFQIDRFDNGPSYRYQRKARQRGLVIPRYGEEIDQIVRYPWIIVTPYDFEVRPEIHMADLLDAQFDAAADILNDAGREMAVKEDLEFLRLFNAAIAPNGTPAAGPNPSFSATTGLYQMPSAVDPTSSDILKVAGYLRQKSYKPDTLLMNPYELGILSAQQAFLFYLNFGTREVQETGVIKSALGLNVIWSPLVDTGSIWVMDSVELGRMLEREPLTVQPSLDGRMMKWLVYERVSPFFRNANACLRIQAYNF
jgi:hypothetical protein